MAEPLIINQTVFAMLMCVPSDWSEEQILSFAEHANPSGTEAGWRICREGDKRLGGAQERTPCPDTGRAAGVVVGV